MTLGEMVRGARTERKWTQKLLAQKLGVSRTYVSKMEHGAEIPSFLHLRQVAKLLRLPFRELSDAAKRARLCQLIISAATRQGKLIARLRELQPEGEDVEAYLTLA